MIEKIKSPLDLKVGNYKGTEFDIIPADTFAMVCRKINELVDAVNELTSCVGQLGVEFTDRETKEPVDPYKKQRKWVGKLCRFRDKHAEVWEYGTLETVENVDHAIDSAFRSSDGYWYDICEPIKPDDDIIYKGEQ